MTDDVVAGILIAAGLIIMGRWGRRNAGTLPSLSLGAELRERKERELRRGALALTVLGIAVAVAVLVRLVLPPVR